MDRYVMSEVPPHVRSQPEVLVRLFHGQVSCRACAGRCTSSEELTCQYIVGKNGKRMRQATKCRLVVTFGHSHELSHRRLTHKANRTRPSASGCTSPTQARQCHRTVRLELDQVRRGRFASVEAVRIARSCWWLHSGDKSLIVHHPTNRVILVICACVWG
jgi:hypothetical protein